MKFTIRITGPAASDLRLVRAYIAEVDDSEIAEKIFEGLVQKINSLKSLANRGNVPPEIEFLDIQVREIHESPYRIIYEVIEQNVYIYRILDARRNIYDILTDEKFMID